MKYILLLFIISCATKYENRWCFEPDDRLKRCYASEEECIAAKDKKNSGLFCKASEKL